MLTFEELWDIVINITTVEMTSPSVSSVMYTMVKHRAVKAAIPLAREDFHLYPTFTLLIDGSSSMDFCCVPYFELECFFMQNISTLCIHVRVYTYTKHVHKYT